MRALPRISVITPSYNQASFITQTIEFVLSQGYPDLEYIVMDGGSTDGTIEILKKYDDRLQWISEKDRGQSHALNKGLKKATGDIFAFINSDDVYEPGALMKVGKFFANHPQAAWLTGRCPTIDESGREIRPLVTGYKNFWLFFKSYKALLVLDYVSQPATFWRIEVFNKVGGFDETLRYAMDYDFSLRVGQYYKLCALKDVLARFRVHCHSKAGSSPSAQFDADLEIVNRYVRSKTLYRLHALHSAIIVGTYWYLLNRRSMVSIPATGSNSERQLDKPFTGN